jgi:hypothetical protein
VSQDKCEINFALSIHENSEVKIGTLQFEIYVNQDKGQKDLSFQISKYSNQFVPCTQYAFNYFFSAEVNYLFF